MDTNITKLLAFVKTVEYGSFTKAAEILNYSQSGISRMISDLEDEWHITLLERGKSGVKLTSDGAELLNYAQTVCEAYDGLRSEIDALNGLQAGLIRIGTFSSVATHWLPNIIARFREDYPNIEYELLLGDYTEIEEWVLSGRVDCGFLSLPVNYEFETIFLERDELTAILPENHPAARLKKIPVKELCSESFLLLEKGGKAEITAIFEREGLTPNVRFTTWDDYAIMSMTEKNLGVSVLPRLILKRVPYRIAVRPIDPPAYRDIVFAMRKGKTASLAVKRFKEYLKYRDCDADT